ncbi:MAG: methyltransferase domain-containing protein [Alphaproteobacteria bacterium]|nr:methyltransferase domain-containing protein [Alphaproteobacteria bacterium]
MTVYSDSLNPDLLDRIPLDAARVLDVGCNAGALGLEFKCRNPATRYYGIETDADAAAIARTRLDEVATTSVEDDPFPFGDTLFDCIVFGDVLEHLIDPWRVIRLLSERLTEAGVMVICMPNVEHWSFAERILRGTFDYADQGLFDRTHLRWFTFETTQRAIREAGLAPYDVLPRIFDRQQAISFANAMRPALETLGIDVQHYASRAAPLQYVWRATRQPIPTMAVFSSMLNPVGGVSHVRVIEPMAALATCAGFTTRILGSFDPGPVDPNQPRIFIFHRPLLAGNPGLAPIRRLLDQGFVVVCEFDDHPAYIPVLQRPDIQNFRAVHAIQTSTEPLAEVLRAQNPEVVVFPNAVNRMQAPRNFTDSSHLTMMFAGINREDEWPQYVPALNAVAALAGERLNFRIVADRGLYDALDTPHKHFTPLCDYDTYQDLLAQSEICFMPLNDTPFNRCKSDLKYIEAATFRVAALASPIVYADSIVDGGTGLIFRTPQELQQRLVRLVANPDAARGLANAARADVTANRMLAAPIRARAAWYYSLWERREELNQQLLARVPELALPAEVLHSGA